MHIGLGYATQCFPVALDEDRDLAVYARFLREPPGMVVQNGTVARVADFAPGYTSAMHRTVSVNYNFLIEGELEIVLDSGETRLLRPGDILVQRAVCHAWRNPSATRWARLAAVSFPATGGPGGGEFGTEGIL